jgi:type IX secretion system PorP/SprF family membrane protein
MKKIILSILFAAGSVYAFAQQDPQFTQFFQTKLNYNAAYAGSGDAGDICAGINFRSQWLGFGSGDKGKSPQTIVGDVHGNFLNGKLGVGLNILSDQQGHENTLIPTISLAYHHTLPNNHKLSAGLGIGLIQKTLDGTKLRAQDQGDVLIPQNKETGSALDLNFGVFYQIPNISIFNDFYAGLSATHLNQAKVEYGSVKYDASMHYYFMTGAVYQLNGDFTLEPNIFVKNATKTSVDINVLTTYRQGIVGGLSYRNVDAFAVLVGYKFKPKFIVMASYDLTTSKLSQFSNGTVEISARYCFALKRTPPTPILRPRFTPRFL